MRAAGHHGDERPRYDQRQGNVHKEKPDDRGHAQEVDEACALEVVEQNSELGELHGLPHHQTREHLHDADQDDADVEEALHGVVAGQVLMTEPQRQRCADLGDDLAGCGSAAACAGSGRWRAHRRGRRYR